MKQLFLRINALDGTECIVPLDNIAFIYQVDTGTRIEFKHKVGTAGSVRVAETVDEVRQMLEGTR